MADRRGRAPDSHSGAKSSRFDVGTLRELAGAKVFARGEEYFCDGHVEILAIEGDRVLAQVAGSEDYRTQLKGRGKRIDGHCSCRAYVDWGFCKHMVAVGLAANAAGDQEGEAGGALSRIREHLKTRSADDLADMIIGLAERDTQLFRKLEIAAAATRPDDETLEPRLRKAIDNATRVNRYIDYSSAQDWADTVDEALDAVEALASSARAGIALKLAERAIDRIGRASESIDDSDGHIGMLLNRAVEIHLAAAAASRPDPVQFARDLFAREIGDDFGAFAGAVRGYAEVLGEDGLAEYRRLAETAWQKLAKRSTRSQDDSSPDLHQLMGILDFFAEREGDLDARIALRSKDLSSPYDYLELAEFCLSQGREAEALRRGEEGLWMFEDGRPDERLVRFTSDLLVRAGRKDDAEQHLWRAFENQPSFELFAELRKLGGVTAGQRGIVVLEAVCNKELAKGRCHTSDLLIEVLMHEKTFNEAWAALRKFGGSRDTSEELACASEMTHARQALEVYEQSVEQLVRTSAYPEAAKLVARMAKLRSAADQANYVAALKERHNRKRNFMRLLG